MIKNQGIHKMMDLVGGSLEDVVVFDDDYNDWGMFQENWICIAIGNACDGLKKK